MFSLPYRHGGREMAPLRLCPGTRCSAFLGSKCDSPFKIPRHVRTETCINATQAPKRVADFSAAFPRASY